MHKLLSRQLKRYFGETEKVPVDFERFLTAIDEAYQHFDEDRAMIERSLELSSSELNGLNQRLEEEVEKQADRSKELERQNASLNDAKRAMLNLLEDGRELEESLQKRTEQLESLNTSLATEKARAEGVLRYLRSIGEGVYATDRNGTVVFVNDAAMGLVGQTEEQLIGSDSRELFHFCVGKEINADCLLPTERALEESRTHVFPRGTFLLRADHQPLPISGTFAPIFEDGRTVGAIIVFQDITERYELEKMKENFLSIAAHQLRTPLGSMRWSMELLKGGDLGAVSPEAQAALSQLYENSGRMLTIVNDLLNVSRIDQGRAKEESVTVDMLALLDEVITTMQGAMEERKIQLEFQPPKKKLPPLTVARKHLFEAIENLVANAVRYNREGGKITITLGQEKQDIVLSVTDTGIGIPEGDQKKIFSKFFRAANAVKHFTDGSGLGLSVVKSYIEENDGTVTFVSTQDVGTTFTVRLPIERKKPVILS